MEVDAEESWQSCPVVVEPFVARGDAEERVRVRNLDGRAERVLVELLADLPNGEPVASRFGPLLELPALVAEGQSGVRHSEAERRADHELLEPDVARLEQVGGRVVEAWGRGKRFHPRDEWGHRQNGFLAGRFSPVGVRG